MPTVDDKELARLLQLSQGPLTENQKTVLLSHFGLVASELVVRRASQATATITLGAVRAYLDSEDHNCSGPYVEALIQELKGILGND